jgi:hypothetical protein
MYDDELWWAILGVSILGLNSLNVLFLSVLFVPFPMYHMSDSSLLFLLGWNFFFYYLGMTEESRSTCAKIGVFRCRKRVQA